MKIRTRPLLLALTVVAASLVLAFAWRRNGAEVAYSTVNVDRGDILDVVGATGTLEAVVTVQVGSQVSGTIQSLYADFNTQVKKGQVIARLDPSLFEARLGQAKANLISAHANVERSRAQVGDTEQKDARARELADQTLLPVSDLETAKANFDAARAQVKASEAAVSQAQANVNQAELDLSHTVIATPIDGVVIARNVDVGQTVAASFQAPVLFVIANDLAKMRVNAAIDEADVGRIEPGQEVSFRVDAYPDRTFAGRIEQVRLQPTTVQNVVTYNTIISVDNAELKLRPGMTATVSVIVHRADDALRIPAAALRFRPEGFVAPTGGRRAQGAGGPTASVGPGGGAPGAPSGSGGPRRGEGRGRRAAGASADRAQRGLVFVLDEKAAPKPNPVALGISDGQFVEVKDGLAEGTAVVTGIDGGARGGAARPTAAASTNPFNPGPPQRRQR
ncbi:MAG TPA: efflux RND transporter periplasmic adaptor subunit [Vicinamibacteria bacterium]